MLNSTPVSLQAILWPLVGAAAVVALSRFLPQWLGRLAAVAAALASVWALWSLRAAGPGRVELLWEPLNLFRMSPTLYPEELALVVGMALAGWTAAATLGIQGAAPQKAVWHGLILAALSGCLVMAMAANVLTLALGSGLIDLALIMMAISARGNGDEGQRVLWRMAIPGVLSTLALFGGAVWMDGQAGTASLLAHKIPAGVITLLGVSGLLRLMVFPFHPRGLSQPEQAATLILLLGMGIGLLARAQALSRSSLDLPAFWIAAGASLLAGGWMVWTGSFRSKRSQPGATMLGLAVLQAGLALAFVLTSSAGMPWPLLGAVLAMGVLTIWWDSSLERPATPRRPEPGRIEQWLSLRRARLGVLLAERLPGVVRWRGLWPLRHGAVLLPAVALASLAGAPLTVGAVTRWQLYGHLLHDRRAAMLLGLLFVDLLLAAGLWGMAATLPWPTRQGRRRRVGDRRTPPASLLAMTILALLIVLIGIEPRRLAGASGMKAASPAPVSAWGLGFIYALPWLIGSWLARITAPAERLLAPLQRLGIPERLYRAADWAAKRVRDAVYWVSAVGEGEGWWAWALIILAVATLFLTAR